MTALECNFGLGCGPGMDYPEIYIFQCTLEQTDAVTNEDLEPITSILAYRTVCPKGAYESFIELNVLVSS
jgi:hypothetical protein